MKSIRGSDTEADKEIDKEIVKEISWRNVMFMNLCRSWGIEKSSSVTLQVAYDINNDASWEIIVLWEKTLLKNSPLEKCYIPLKDYYERKRTT